MDTPSKDGTRIHFADTGSDAGAGTGNPVLVFVHGWCCNQTHWAGQVAHFASSHRCITLDLAGHGQSPPERTNWSIRAFAEDVVAVADACDLDKIVLIGHSMGGPVIAEAARHLEGRAIALVGADTFKFTNPPPTEEQIQAQLEPLRQDWSIAEESVRKMFVSESDPTLIERIVREMVGTGPEVGIPALHALRSNTADHKAAVQELTIPIYAINARAQTPDPKRAEALGIKVTLMEGIGHFVMMEDTAVFNQELQTILDALTV